MTQPFAWIFEVGGWLLSEWAFSSSIFPLLSGGRASVPAGYYAWLMAAVMDDLFWCRDFPFSSFSPEGSPRFFSPTFSFEQEVSLRHLGAFFLASPRLFFLEIPIPTPVYFPFFSPLTLTTFCVRDSVLLPPPTSPSHTKNRPKLLLLFPVPGRSGTGFSFFLEAVAFFTPSLLRNSTLTCSSGCFSPLLFFFFFFWRQRMVCDTPPIRLSTFF